MIKILFVTILNTPDLHRWAVHLSSSLRDTDKENDYKTISVSLIHRGEVYDCTTLFPLHNSEF